jgi:hypothetical protein
MYDLQAVVEIATERAALDHGLEIGVGGRDDAHVDPDVLIAADAHELPLLEHPEQLHLGCEVGLADLVQKQRTAVGCLELPSSPRMRARERALLVAEQLRFDQIRRDRSAVDAEERKIAARRVEVDGPRDQLLAHAALTEDEHRCPKRRDAEDPVEHRAHRGGVADEVLDAVVLRNLVLEKGQTRVEVVPLEEAHEPSAQLERVGRAEDVIVGALPQEAYGIEDARGVDDEEDRGRRCRAAKGLDESFVHRAVEIEEDGVVRPTLVQLERLSSADGQRRRELRSREHATNPFRVVPVGVENEDALLIGGQTAHGPDYIDERRNPAIMTR